MNERRGSGVIRYGDEAWTELKFASYRFKAERRDEQWVDVTVRVETADGTPLPDDLIDLSILAICTPRGQLIQLVVQDEGCDSEYQLTEGEKEQLETAVGSEAGQAAIAAAL